MRFSRYVWYVHSTKLEKTSLRFANGLALNSSASFRLVLIKWLSANGDGEIRTPDPSVFTTAILPEE